MGIEPSSLHQFIYLFKQEQPSHNLDYNVVVRGVRPDIEIDEFAAEITTQDIEFRSITRIFANNGEKTHMVRIFSTTETRQAGY